MMFKGDKYHQRMGKPCIVAMRFIHILQRTVHGLLNRVCEYVVESSLRLS